MCAQEELLSRAGRLLRKAGYLDISEEDPNYHNDLKRALEKFQKNKGLRVTGKLDSYTWQALVESTWKLGDRLLYLTSPMLRGEDVAALQTSLISLGIDVGKVDGIFGPVTEHAVKDFQRQTGITIDGIFGPATLRELRRVTTSYANLHSIHEIKKVFHQGIQSPKQILICSVGINDLIGPALLRKLNSAGINSLRLTEPEGESLIGKINEINPDLCIALNADIEDKSLKVCYYKGFSFESLTGKHLATAIANALQNSLKPFEIEMEILGLSLPILRETKMPTVLLEFCEPLVHINYAEPIADSLFNAILEELPKELEI
jgi:N-acetylmuramoyl-L-alanine amidase